ncbi:hypothetical protein [Alkalihalobacillus sp. AL-G]|uniref:hypothetical protein n=1 Tax=Alkalihalobacillus sp. AL-G TaxID=2926399 RepID=UPI002729E959|nr:hypothetical protein [Alkalihalobacillus sp. AL-G]WLD91715.1 hypothetical protein MOJ78_11740 [Alkalihalobacillus sp. AL-G]
MGDLRPGLRGTKSLLFRCDRKKRAELAKKQAAEEMESEKSTIKLADPKPKKVKKRYRQQVRDGTLHGR